MQYAIELDQKIHDAIAHNDAEALQALLEEHYQPAASGNRPYDAAIELKPAYLEELGGAQFESDAALTWANKIDRAKRRVAYNLKTAFGWQGTRIVSEGDSWFQYPLVLSDVIDNFASEPDFAVLSVGAAGDLVQHMAIRREYDAAIRETQTRVLLLSGGGNDLLGDGRLKLLLNPHVHGATASALINQGALQSISHDILTYYEQILRDVHLHHPNVTIFGHGYDTPFPMQGEKYFGIPFEQAGIPLALGRQVIELIVDSFADKLGALAARYANYRFINLKGTVGDHPNSWNDELHPENAGFKRASEPMIAAVRAHLQSLPVDLGTESASLAEAPLHPAQASFDGMLEGGAHEVPREAAPAPAPTITPVAPTPPTTADIFSSMLAERINGPFSGDDVDEGCEAARIHRDQAIAFEQLDAFPIEGLSILKRIFGPLKRQNFDYDAFAAHIGKLDLRYFTPREFLYLGGANDGGDCGERNTVPPREVWDNLTPTALMLDEIRHRLGAPVRILSTYRSEVFNACIGGAPTSLHLQFRAIDFCCDGGTPDDWCRVAQEVRAERASYTGGIGRYDASGFVHIDTRGYVADWRV